MTLGIDVSRLFSDMVLVRGDGLVAWLSLLRAPTTASPGCSGRSCPLRLLHCAQQASPFYCMCMCVAARRVSRLVVVWVTGVQHQGHRRQKDGVLVPVQLRRRQRRSDVTGHQYAAKGLVWRLAGGRVGGCHCRAPSRQQRTRRALTTPPRCCWAAAVRHRARRSLSLVSCMVRGTSNG